MKFLSFFILSMLMSHVHAQDILINSGDVWKYYDQGQAPVDWNQISFNDASWGQGNAELGYGDGDEATSVNYGPNSSDKYITTYFRKEIFVTDPSVYALLSAELVRDDGAVVYVNGNEVWRSNMPGGGVNFGTTASGTVAWPFEDDWHTSSFSAAFLQQGSNVIAVEIHQDDPSSSDISFNFKLNADFNINASVIRGPYLQKANQNSIILRWRTDSPTDSRVRFGLSPMNLNMTSVDPLFTTEHSIQLTGLLPNTTYFYSIGTNNTVLLTGNNLFFKTLPVTGSEGVYRFMVIGDAGTGNPEQIEAKNAAIQFNNGNHFDGMILLGDNAYESGFDSEYQNNFFDGKYNEIFENTVIWPAPGNHDYNNHIPFSPSPAYYDIFDCPSNGESGGIPSGTEKYYSFNHGNIHFISLDSYDEPRSVTGAMATWLQQDLVSNQQPWVVVFFHHPPYTKGSHDSDNTFFLDGELVDMRENIMPILENYGVDLILNGHSHSYERSYLIDGHYGDSDSFGPQHQKDAGSGRYPQSCPYQKNTSNGVGHQGSVYAVVGCSGKLSDVQSDWPHPAMYSFSNEHVGSLILTVNKNRLDAVFLTKDGVSFDNFTIVKNAGVSETVFACPNDEINLQTSWPQTAVWNPGGQTGLSYSIFAWSNSTVTATDPQGCISDVYNIVVVQDDTCFLSNTEISNGANMPFIQIENKKLKISFDQSLNLLMYNSAGQLVKEIKAEKPEHEENISTLTNGIYILKCSELNLNYKIYIHD